MRYYAGDPRWLDAVRYPADCSRCGRRIEKGERAFYYPKGKSLYCDSDGCGRAESRSFEAAAFDEEVMSRGF